MSSASAHAYIDDRESMRGRGVRGRDNREGKREGGERRDDDERKGRIG